MQARQLPTSRGWAWLREGWLLWRRNPALLTFLTFGYLMMLVVLSLLPFIGLPLMYLLTPVLSLGVLNGCRAIDEGRKAGPDVLFSGFRMNLQTLVTIGGLYLVASLLALVVTMIADGGALLRLMAGGQVDQAVAETPAFSMALLIALVLSTPVMMAYWFAPLLAGWWNLPAPKAMFFSFFACLRNWRPFFGYAVGLMLFAAVLPGLFIGTIALVSPILGRLLSLVVPLALIPILFGSFYANARDVFGLPSEAPPVDAKRD